MGFGGNFGGSLRLEISARDGDSKVTLGSINIPQKTAKLLNSTGGESIELNWLERKGEERELLAAEAMPKISALKGAVG